VKGRKHTIRTHPRVKEITEKILSGGVSYREIAEEYGVSVSAIKHFAVRVKNEPSNNEPSNRDMSRRIESERERREAETDLRNEKDKKIDALRSKFARTGEYATPQELAEVGLGEPPEYSEESQRAEPVLKLASDPGFRPGFQSPDRAQQFDFECRARERDRRRRWYADPFNWHRPIPPDFR